MGEKTKKRRECDHCSITSFKQAYETQLEGTMGNMPQTWFLQSFIRWIMLRRAADAEEIRSGVLFPEGELLRNVALTTA